jgi:hypothetical protein
LFLEVLFLLLVVLLLEEVLLLLLLVVFGLALFGCKELLLSFLLPMQM